MANVFLANGSNVLLVETLGDITSSKLRFRIKNLTYSNIGGYLISQGGATTSESEFGLWVSANGDNAVTVILGGISQNIGNYIDVFGLQAGETLDNQEVDITIEARVDATPVNLTVSVDGVQTFTTTVTRGTGRLDGRLFRVGARGGNTVLAVSNSSILPSGNKVGDVDIWLDDVLSRSIIMPVDNTGATDGDFNTTTGIRIYNGDGDDFEEVTSGTPVTTRRVTFEVKSEIITLGVIDYSIQRLPLGTGVLLDSGTLDFASTTQEFNLDLIEAVTDGMPMCLTVSDSTSSANDDTAGVMFATSSATVVTV